MELLRLEWNWKYVAIMFALALFITIVSFDMIAHWDTKKREDLRILLLGTGLFGILILLITTNARIALLSAVVIVTLFVAGWMGSSENFDTSSKPWELYFIAIGSLVALLGAIVWAYFKTDTGKYVRRKGGEFREGVKKRRQDYRDYKKMKEERAIEDLENDTRLANTTENPLFDPIWDSENEY